ncbi:MAG: phosphotransferase, partial [Pseudomonadota bacterium]
MTTGDHQDKVAASLEEDLRRKTGHEGLRLACELHRMIGGFDTETYAFRLHGAPDTLNGDLVLRLFRASDPSDRVRFESTIQEAMATRSYPAPGVPLDTAGREIMGRPYLVMRRLPGRSLLELMLAGPADSSDDHGAELLARTQARLHGLSATEAMIALARAGLDPSMHTPFRLLTDIQELGQATGDRILIELGRWLEDRRPPEPEVERVCHGDFHPGNMLVENMQATGVIDWTNVAFGHVE